MARNSSRCQLVEDGRGELVDGVLFEFGVHYERDELEKLIDRTWFVVDRDDNDGIFHCRAISKGNLGGQGLDQQGDSSETYGCPISSNHKTQGFSRNMFLEVFLDGEQTEFVPVVLGSMCVVKESFQSQIERSGLLGVVFHSIDQEFDKHHPLAPPPPVSLMEFRGKILCRPRVVVGVPSACPYCGHKPVICPGCGMPLNPCENCGHHIFQSVNTPKLDDRRVVVGCNDPQGRVLNGSSWDGADFCSHLDSKFITKRALWWLQMIHARQFYARPARVCIDGMSEAQLAWLKRAADPASLGK